MVKNLLADEIFVVLSTKGITGQAIGRCLKPTKKHFFIFSFLNFVANGSSRGKLSGKYHSKGLGSITSCSHLNNEEVIAWKDVSFDILCAEMNSNSHFILYGSGGYLNWYVTI